MVSITFKRSLSIDTQRGYVAAVEPGVPYLLTDYQLGESIPRELTSSIEPFNEFERFDGRSLGEGSLLIMWLAGLGDTISAAPALLALQEQNPAARIDVASAARLFEIF